MGPGVVGRQMSGVLPPVESLFSEPPGIGLHVKHARSIPDHSLKRRCSRPAPPGLRGFIYAPASPPGPGRRKPVLEGPGIDPLPPVVSDLHPRSCGYGDLLADVDAGGDEDEAPDGDVLADADGDGVGDVRTDGEAAAVGDWYVPVNDRALAE